MCAENHKNCTYDSLIETRDTEALCDKAASFISEKLLVSRAVIYSDDANPDPREVVSVALYAPNRHVDQSLIDAFNDFASVATREVVEVSNLDLAMSA